MLLADVLATGGWEKEVIMAEAGEAEGESPSFTGVGHLGSSACFSRCWIIYSTQEGETEKFIFFIYFFFISRDILFEIYFVF